MIEGVDYAGAHPSPTGLASAGKRFACRYGGPGGSWKHITASEASALRAAGIAIVANAEGYADGLLGGYSAGRAWAIDALAHFRACGMPDWRPIYLSVDFDAGSSHWSAIDAALRGAASYLGADQVGVYGGYDTIAHCVNAGTARWYWQTYAWSGGRWHPRAHIQQYRNGVSLAGGTVDLNRATVGDYGQWGTREADMPGFIEDQDARVLAWRARGILTGVDPVTSGLPGDPKEVNALHRTLGRIEGDVADLVERPASVIDPAQFVAALVADAQAMDAIAQAIAARVGLIPTAQEIGRATADILRERLES